jgi:lycopene beta-cyclase
MKYQLTAFAVTSWHTTSTAFTFPASRISSKSVVTSLFDTASGINESADDNCDVLVLGSGPAARSIASLLSKDLDVLLADTNYDRRWPPNYGVWEDGKFVHCIVFTVM